MTFLEILSTILIEPLILIFEIIYIVANKVINNPGLSIIVLSLVMNFLILPLYIRADALQEEEKEIEQKLRKGVAHIKKTFKGDERMMMLQTFYRQNNYKPTYVLRGAVSLFLEIPFFIAAYRFLSELQLLQGVSFGPIADLGKPDALLTIGGIAINVLPIIMTTVNLISCVIFTKGSSAKQKIQLYGMALFFLVFLYTSPSGLVFYWTLNNIFSLVKTIFYKLKNPVKILSIMSSIAGVGILIGGIGFYPVPTLKKTLFFAVSGVLLQMPALFAIIKSKADFNSLSMLNETPRRGTFVAGGIFLSILTGVLIPSSVISASPQEFVDINYFYNPLWFLVSAFCLAFGIFVVWGNVFYGLAKKSIKVIFDKLIWVFSGIALINYMFFGKNLGLLNTQLKFENDLNFSWKIMLINFGVLVCVIVLLWFVDHRWKKKVTEILVIGAFAIGGMGILNITSINQSINQIENQTSDNKEDQPQFTLSKKGKNVIVLMLDRAMGDYVPYLFNEKPELKEKFSGFTYYNNVLSYGTHTNFAAPALFGGYEYTPTEMNKRDNESLVSKHNEALKVMPVLFDQNGYDVTVCDPTYANYRWIPDLSIYDEYPEIQTYITRGKFTNPSIKKQNIETNKRNFFCYGIMKTSPLCLQELLYDQGRYNQGNVKQDGTTYSVQTTTSPYTAEGIRTDFMEAYNVLINLPSITNIVGDERNTFLMMTNDTTHDLMMLQTPEYVPVERVDNTEYIADNLERYTVNGQTLKMTELWQNMTYQGNMAALIQVGEWLDYLRVNDVYDNTRIIIVADHGAEDLYHREELILEDGEDISGYYPLLMVKDFNSKEFTVSDEFMTNGDVPTLATSEIIKEPVNVFTGNKINSEEKYNKEQYVISSDDWTTDVNNGNTFLPAKWYSVHKDMRDKNNWEIKAKDVVLTGEE